LGGKCCMAETWVYSPQLICLVLCRRHSSSKKQQFDLNLSWQHMCSRKKKFSHIIHYTPSSAHRFLSDTVGRIKEKDSLTGENHKWDNTTQHGGVILQNLLSYLSSADVQKVSFMGEFTSSSLQSLMHIFMDTIWTGMFFTELFLVLCNQTTKCLYKINSK